MYTKIVKCIVKFTVAMAGHCGGGGGTGHCS